MRISSDDRGLEYPAGARSEAISGHYTSCRRAWSRKNTRGTLARCYTDAACIHMLGDRCGSRGTGLPAREHHLTFDPGRAMKVAPTRTPTCAAFKPGDISCMRCFERIAQSDRSRGYRQKDRKNRQQRTTRLCIHSIFHRLISSKGPIH